MYYLFTPDITPKVTGEPNQMNLTCHCYEEVLRESQLGLSGVISLPTITGLWQAQLSGQATHSVLWYRFGVSYGVVTKNSLSLDLASYNQSSVTLLGSGALEDGVCREDVFCRRLHLFHVDLNTRK